MENRHATTLPLAAEYQALTNIGLSVLSALCYQIIYQQDFISAQEIAALINKPYRGIYRIIYGLREKGFIEHVYTGRHPYKYTAVLLPDALDSYVSWQRAQVVSLTRLQKRRYHEQALQKMSAAERRRG